MESENDLLLLGDREIIDLAVGAQDSSSPAANDALIMQEDVINVDAQKDEEYERRRKRRRLMRRMLKPGAKPSFVALLEPRIEDAEEEEPKRFVIDVDEYLGLKKAKPEPEAVPSSVASRNNKNNTAASAILPSDEGWFEGCIPLSLPGEEQFLPELQTAIRRNLEIFSATEADANAPQPGRRTRIVRGKVGVRCVHCSKAIQANPSLPWPAGSVSYPLNILGLYPCCSQKPQLHFQNCPHMPEEAKVELHRLMYNEDGGPRARKRNTTSVNGDKPMSAALYYTIAAKMIGMVDVPDGMRFGRDLALEPLPLETVQAQIEEMQVPYSRTTTTSSKVKPEPVLSTEPRIAADVESERVLAQAVAEKDHPLLLAKSDDKKMVTDHIFLCIKQMAICHATKADFATRGKKTRMMKLGFAGFCCRHCAHFNPKDGVVHYVDYSCRSFSSAADNLASAISNSFYLHVVKCPATPLAIRNALAAYKRIHTRQMGQLQHGSQRRMFQILWSRLRATDLSKEEVEEREKNMAPLPEPIATPAAAAPREVVAESSSAVRPDEVSSTLVSSDGRRGSIPVCDDERTVAVLKKAEEDWDPTVNDNLILPADRNLVSDFVFLMMRQLKAAHPIDIDFSRGKRNTVNDPSQPGLKCIHCMNKTQAPFFKSAVGRSFPSAPDNMASTMNSSMFQHLQKCPFAPEDVKWALANLKKIHSTQCASLRFGSQRRFFNLVFERLREAPNDEQVVAADESATTTQAAAGASSPATAEADDLVLAQYGFVETANGCFECQSCRMVPLSLRARDSISIGRPAIGLIQGHVKVCKKVSFDLSGATEALKAVSDKHFALGGAAILSSPPFGDVIRAVLGGKHELAKAFTDGLMQTMMDDQDMNDEEQQQPNSLVGLWNEFPSSVDCGAVKTTFTEFAATVPDLNSDLSKEPGFLRFFRIISPSFVIPAAVSANESNENPSEGMQQT